MKMSLNEKIVLAHDLGVVLGEQLNEETLQTDNHTAEMIWGHADGLSAKRLYRLRDGRCSLQASIDFNVLEEELELDKEIELMKDLKKEK